MRGALFIFTAVMWWWLSFIFIWWLLIFTYYSLFLLVLLEQQMNPNIILYTVFHQSLCAKYIYIGLFFNLNQVIRCHVEFNVDENKVKLVLDHVIFTTHLSKLFYYYYYYFQKSGLSTLYFYLSQPRFHPVKN